MARANKIVLLIIFFGFILSVGLSLNNLSKYDKNIITNGYHYHQMIKADTYRYLRHGSEIKDQLNDGINFFKTGREHYTKYLPPRIIAAYYYFFDIDLFNNDKDKLINIGIHFPYLLFQSIIYYLCVILFYFSLLKIFKPITVTFIVAFLSLEPTVMQYHSSFWSESIFFSIQILLISLILKKNFSNFNFFLIGIFLAVLSLQKDYAIFYIVPILIYFYFILSSSKIKKFTYLIAGFFLIQSILGLNNYFRSGKFYIMTADSKINLHRDLVAKVMTKKYKNSNKEFRVVEVEATLNWINKNSIKYNTKEIEKMNKPGYADYRETILFEKDKTIFDDFIRNRTIDYFLKYPMDFGKFIIKSSIHIILLNPFHIYSDNNFKSGEIYYSTDTHDKLIPYRIIYTLFVYMICLFGLLSIIQKKNYDILLYLMFSIIYFYGLVSWHGNTRYFMPVVIYLSLFFGFGIDKIINYRKK